MVKTEILWEGSCSFNNLLVSVDPRAVYNPYYTQILNQDQVDSIWNDHLKKFPKSYNGMLVTLDNIEVDEKFDCGCEILTLEVGNISYSQFIAMREKHIPFENFGILGTQCLLFNKARTHILVGKRKNESYYCPGKLTVPGGILEKHDLESLEGIAREVREEVRATISKIKINTVLREHENYSTIVLLTGEIEDGFNPESTFPGNEEWEDQKLFWISIESLKNIPESDLMEGLSYFKSKL